jgi:type I thyroxine 5'-deiodinase
MNVDDGVVYEQPKSEDDRANVAEACVIRLNFKMPMVLDEMSNEADESYAALPERLYMLDAQGRIRYRSGPGPWGFDVDAWEASIRAAIEA